MNSRFSQAVRPFLLIVLAALSGSLVAAGRAADEVSILAPYVRAVPPGQPNSAVFMQLHNKSSSSHAIVSAESPVAKLVELHTHIMEEGLMKMRQVKKIDIPAQGTATLQPGGLHVMLLDLTTELRPDQLVTVSLIFEDGSKTTIQAPVRKLQMHMKHKY